MEAQPQILSMPEINTQQSLNEKLKLVCIRMDIPERFQGKGFKTFVGFKEEIERARKAIAEGKSILLTGAAGLGKTHIAVALMLEWLMKNKPEKTSWYPKFLPAVELFLELKRTFNNEGSEKDVLDKYSAIKLLCIDDVGAEKVSDWSRQSFYTLIDRRYREMKQTIITSNLSLEKISSLIDDRIASRIVEMGIVVEMQGEDYRLKQ